MQTGAVVETGLDVTSLQETEELLYVGRREGASEDLIDYFDRDLTLTLSRMGYN